MSSQSLESKAWILDGVYFTGDRKEFDRFLYYIKDALLVAARELGTEKMQIDWIARHFRYPAGKHSMVESPLSYQWWIGLLEKNARACNKPISHTVSTYDTYKLPELASTQAFLVHLKEAFGCDDAQEDRRKALTACKQGDQNIRHFNPLFNSLVYGVDLTESERCDIYEEALNVGLLTTAIKHTGWREAKTLEDKQDLARSAAYIQHKLAQIPDSEAGNPENHVDQQPNVPEHPNREPAPEQAK